MPNDRILQIKSNVRAIIPHIKVPASSLHVKILYTSQAIIPIGSERASKSPSLEGCIIMSNSSTVIGIAAEKADTLKSTVEQQVQDHQPQYLAEVRSLPIFRLFRKDSKHVVDIVKEFLEVFTAPAQMGPNNNPSLHQNGNTEPLAEQLHIRKEWSSTKAV